MFERFSRSWTLVKASAEVLKKDKELMVFPLCSAIATIAVLASFALPLWASGAFEHMEQSEEGGVMLFALGFLFYLVSYFVIFYFNSALVGAALIRLNGGDPTVADGFRIANSRLGSILGYAAIAATVGIILRAIEEEVGWVGKFIVGLIGVAFTLATFLVVPILVSKNIGPIDAIKESSTLLKKTWGENIIGNGGLGLAFVLIYALLIMAGVGLFIAAASVKSMALMVIIAALVVIGFVLLSLAHASLQGIYSAALYRYCVQGEGGDVFDQSLMQNAFKLKA